MSFLSPLALLVGTLSVPLLLLYFLKVRRRQATVSSLLLWNPALRDREASTFFQRLQRDPLLILQLLALLALALALARPAVTVMGHGAKRIVVVLDTSASMKATDVSPSRFVLAQRKALDLVNGLGAGAEVMVIEAGVQPRVLVPFSHDREQLLAALRNAYARDLPNRLGESVRTARALVGQDARAEIHVFTDGAHPAALRGQAEDVRVRWVGVGQRGRNVAITSLAVRRNYMGAFDSQAFVSFANFSDRAESFGFSLTIDGEMVAEKTLTLDPQVRRAVVLPFSHAGGGVLRARLNVSDDLSADDAAYAIIAPARTIRVLLVSPGNLFLEKELSTDPQVKLEVRTPDAYQGGMDGFDVVVLDSVSPPRIGSGRFVLVNTSPPDVPLEVLGRLESPVIMDWDRSHPIMRQVDFAKVAIEDALRVRPLAAGKTLVEAVGGPIVYLLEEPNRKAVFFGFDLFRSDLPLRVAFPVMMSRALRWLHPADLDQASLSLQTGQPILLLVEHGVTTATVRTPSGRSVRAQVARGAISFTETDEVGVYTVATSRGETKVAVNLFTPDESELHPKPLPSYVEGARPDTAPVPLVRELWQFAAALVVLLLAIEGFLYWRRQTAGRLGVPHNVGDRWALGVRCVVVVFVLLALVRPAVPRWVDRLNVVFLLDVSDSVSLAARESAFRFAAQSAGGARPGDQAGVIVFGEEAVVAQPLRLGGKIDRPQVQVGGRGTNLAQALQLALATTPPGHANRFVLLSDGRPNAGNALAVAQAAKDAGADIWYVPAPLTFRQEVVVESMLLPREVKFGEPFQAKVVAWSQAETQGRLSMFRNGEFLGSQVVKLNAGKNVFAYRQSLEQSGIHVYQAALDVEGDIIDENNRSVGTVVVRGRPQVLLVEKDKSQAQALTAALRAQHVDVELVETERIPKDAAGLQKYDGVILSNVSSLKMTKKQMEGIRDYVREQGGGLIMLGGEESFGLGGYYRTPIEEALPVTMEVKQKVEIPSLAVVLSIDRSGSMAMT
ncbi:MAG: VWA domain-containing protein, partial [Candidatus Rokubacteria bacterium]|nr:VWA domain-containing protein [Candidatus Rokubacteria bacterium]